MVQILNFLAIILLMLVTGIFWGPWFSLHRSLKRFSRGEFLKIVKTLADNLARPMRLLMPASILFLALSTGLYPDKMSIGFWIRVIALLLTLFSLLVTLVTEVPLVSQMREWTEMTMPYGWEKLRDNWVKFHTMRTFSSLASFACLVISVLIQNV